jgi:hypothetical protein
MHVKQQSTLCKTNLVVLQKQPNEQTYYSLLDIYGIPGYWLGEQQKK